MDNKIQEPSKKIVESTEEKDSPEYPDFMETAERVPYEQQNEVAEYKRAISDSKVPENLVEATGEEVTVFHLGKRLVPMLKMRLDNGAPIYIPRNEVGANYRHMPSLIGKKMKISVTTFDQTDYVDDNNQTEYVAIGSIRQAEFIIGGVLYSQYKEAESNDDNSFTDEKRIGQVSVVIDTPDLQMLFINYQGMQIPMYAKQFTYMSYTQPLSDLVHIGDMIRFKISEIKRIKYEDMKDVQEDKNSNRQTPSGLMYLIRTTSLPFRENPNDRVKRLEKSHSAFLAHIVRYNPIKGILVQIAPGWWIKGILPTRTNFKPSINDELAHTPVSVRIESLDYEKMFGRCNIISFPQGVARSPHQKF